MRGSEDGVEFQSGLTYLSTCYSTAEAELTTCPKVAKIEVYQSIYNTVIGYSDAFVCEQRQRFNDFILGDNLD